ncbi:MAG: hypothetical protein QOD06_1926 [Candidatus Binatota bacterium]|jgi:polyvinyl alcohol dehydrogenase (cytochrome)|nr:hypothetical protein [Candidatus Binatota bacterium]
MHSATRAVAALVFASLLAGAANAADWPMYGRDLRRSFHDPSERALSPANVAQLVRKWFFPTLDAVTASPAVVNGVVYVGSWDGSFYAIDAATGLQKWKFTIDAYTPANPDPQMLGLNYPDRLTNDGGVITSSAAVTGGRVYFGGGKTVYALDAATGSPVWRSVICGNPEAADCKNDSLDPTRVFSSPAVFDGKVFVGHTQDGQKVSGKGYRGGLEALDVATGAIVWRFETDPELDNGAPRVGPNGKVVGRNRSCGGVWSSAAIDPESRLLFFNTSDCNYDAPPPYHEAIIALQVDDGSLAWVHRPREEDTCDYDLGATPNVIDVAGGKYVGSGDKDGSYRLLDRTTGLPVWSKRVVEGGVAGGFIGSTAFDGRRVYGATALGDFPQPQCASTPAFQDPSMHAFDVDPTSLGNRIAWQADGNQSFGASVVANGVVLVGTMIEHVVRAYDADSGELLVRLPMPASVSSSPVVVDGMVFVGSGDSHQPTGSGVHAFALPLSALPDATP